MIDPKRHEIFAVADEQVNGSPSHHLVGLDTTTGAVLLDQVVDPPGSTTSAQLQRTGLNLTSGSVVFGLGGNAGDCSTYHGWVIAVPEGGGEAHRFEVDKAASEGAIWMGGAAPVVDGAKNVWVASGNGSNTSGEPQDGDSVLKLSPTMERLDVFTPSTWAHDNAADLDLGSTVPALLSHGHVVQVGKSQTAYVLKRKALGGIGGQISTVTGICGTTFDGGSAISGSTVYLPCRKGPISASVSKDRRTDCQLGGLGLLRRSADPRGRTRVGDGSERSPGQSRPGERRDHSAAGGRFGREPLPDAVRGERAAAGAGASTVVAFGE